MPTPLTSIGDHPGYTPREPRGRGRDGYEQCDVCGAWDFDSEVRACACGCGAYLHKMHAATCEGCDEPLVGGHERRWDECVWCAPCLAEAKRVDAEDRAEYARRLLRSLKRRLGLAS